MLEVRDRSGVYAALPEMMRRWTAAARREAAPGAAPADAEAALPGLSAETARSISETLVLLDLERCADAPEPRAARAG